MMNLSTLPGLVVRPFSRRRREVEANLRWIAPLFDRTYYLARYEGVSRANLGDPLFHFASKGWRQMHNPNEMFDVKWYLQGNSDVAESGMNPVVHYALHGWKEGRDPSPNFSVSYYLDTYPDVRNAGAEPLAHYLAKGKSEGKRPSPAIYIDSPAPEAAVAPTATESSDAGGYSRSQKLKQALARAGLFDPAAYLQMHPDVRDDRADAWTHLLEYGIDEGRRFTSTERVAKALSYLKPEIEEGFLDLQARLSVRNAEEAIKKAAARLSRRDAKIAVYCNSQGNFYMQEIANLLAWQLTDLGIDANQRTEEDSLEEKFDLRIFVAPHEFFELGRGRAWKPVVDSPGSVLFNVEQVQTEWFCRALPLLLHAPLVLDINFQSAVLLRSMGINAVHYMPVYFEGCRYTSYQEDLSHIDLVRGYGFSRSKSGSPRPKSLSERPIDILFVGSGCDRRTKALQSLRNLTDKYRFLCVYTRQNAPLNAVHYRTTSPEINCALAQRAKIVLNIHRDWIGYFEWSRIVMQGFWQGACVVSDPSLPNPLFTPGEHLLEESPRHMAELLDWLLGNAEGLQKMEAIAKAGFKRATDSAARAALLVPMLEAFCKQFEATE
jgi:hypothetical protein